MQLNTMFPAGLVIALAVLFALRTARTPKPKVDNEHLASRAIIDNPTNPVTAQQVALFVLHVRGCVECFATLQPLMGTDLPGPLGEFTFPHLGKRELRMLLAGKFDPDGGACEGETEQHLRCCELCTFAYLKLAEKHGT